MELLQLLEPRDLYLVGGCVRDLLLSRHTVDLDFMVTQDLKESVESIATKLGEKYKTKVLTGYSRFLTAKLTFESPFKGHSVLDFSQTRKETYPKPASTPVVLPGELSEDLRRRDFTINSIALKNDQIVDLTDGRKDLEQKLIRVHHDQSFRDDPIRMIRALRFSIRLDFDIEPQTQVLMESAKSSNYLSLVSPRRRYEELRKVLSEEKSLGILERLQHECLLKPLCPVIEEISGFSASGSVDDKLLSLIDSSNPSWAQYIDSLGLSKEQSKKLKAS
jgi:tRNA nucleotidyltransferase (CCA-adding enzyme)